MQFFASLVPKTAKQEEEARRLGGSIGMDGTYVGSPGQRGERRWMNASFAERGLYTMREAYELARQSRWGNHRLESRVRENRMHGSEGGEGRPFPTPIIMKYNKFPQNPDM